MKKFFFPFLTVCLGVFFLFSAYRKFITIDFFELNLVEAGLADWLISPFLARLIISIEFVVAILLILNFRLRRFTLKFVFLLLFGFSIYLVFLLFTKGNHENCNCFGPDLMLSPLESLIKNLILIVITIILYKFYPGISWDYQRLILIIVILVALGFPYLLNPPEQNAGITSLTFINSEKPDADFLFSYLGRFRPPFELSKGTHVVAFLSMSCPACVLTAYKLHLLKMENPSISILLIINGKLNKVPDFLSRTKAYDIPQRLIPGKDLIKLCGPELPVVWVIKDGRVIQNLTFLELSTI